MIADTYGIFFVAFNFDKSHHETLIFWKKVFVNILRHIFKALKIITLGEKSSYNLH